MQLSFLLSHLPDALFMIVSARLTWMSFWDVTHKCRTVQKALETDFTSVLEIWGVLHITPSYVVLNTTGWLCLSNFLFSDLCCSLHDMGGSGCRQCILLNTLRNRLPCHFGWNYCRFRVRWNGLFFSFRNGFPILLGSRIRSTLSCFFLSCVFWLNFFGFWRLLCKLRN